MAALDLLYAIYFGAQLRYPFVVFVTALLLANLVTGLLVAILPTNPERFKLGALSDWLLRAFIMVAAGGLVSALRVVSPEEYKAYFTAIEAIVWATAIGGLLGKIIQNVADMIGVRLPDPVSFLGDKLRPQTEAKP